MDNSAFALLALGCASLLVPAVRAQVPNSVQYYTDHAAERRATEMKCYQEGATGTSKDLACENAERASWAALAKSSSMRSMRPEQNPASPVYWRLRGSYAARMELQDCSARVSNPIPTPPAFCEAAALSVLDKPR